MVTTVLAVLPSAATALGLATNVVVALLTAPATNVTFVLAVAELAVPVMVFNSALVDASVATKLPVLSVLPFAAVNVLLEPVPDKLTASLGTGLPRASFTTKVSCVVLVPSAVTDVGLADKEQSALTGAPAVKVMAVVALAGPAVAVTVFTSAVVEANVVV